ncbi:polysaccharide biosynthesis protein [Francisellaceae bacterium]|nr:polysaccharide biosynthesis protein [Francisellaceae bacterium]
MIKLSSIKSAHAWMILALDFLMVQCAWILATSHFFERYSWHKIDNTKLIFLAIASLLSFKIFKTYAGLWRYTSTEDLLVIIKSVLLTLLLFLIARFYYDRLIDISRVSLLLFILMSIAFMSGARLISRIYHFGQYRISKSTKYQKNYILIGAGFSGERFLRENLQQQNSHIKVVAILDDNAQLAGKKIKGIPIIGNIELLDASELVKKNDIHGVIIAIAQLNRKKFQNIYLFANKLKLDVKTLPSMEEILAGKITITNLQDVTIEDLLGRDQVELDVGKIQKLIDSKCVLVTGGGGSIGSELVRQVIKLTTPKKLVIIDHSEINLYTIQQDVSGLNAEKCYFHLGNIVDRKYIQSIFKLYRPDIVFHAAAYKHVPLLEMQPKQAFLNNVIGTKALCEIAVQSKVSKFIMVSTDKAVNPSNIMGCTKRIAELICQRYGSKQEHTQFITTRFGNVLGSAGSVIPLFRKQLRKGGPITVTHKDIERFFMTIPEASQLVIYSGCVGRNKDVFVLDMGKPVKISKLAEQLIRLSGKEPYVDIDIVYTGLRPGEKMYEELFYQSEHLLKTDHRKLFKSQNDHMITLESLFGKLEKIQNNLLELEDEEVKSQLSLLIKH